MKQDPVKFINNNLDKLIPFSSKLYNKQEEIVNTIVAGKNTIVKAPRQSGKTTTMICSIICQLLFGKVKIRFNSWNTRFSSLILTNVKTFLKNLEIKFILSKDKRTLYLANGSALTINRDFDVDVLYFDEFAFYYLPQIKQDYYETVFNAHKRHQKKVQVIIVSTPSSNANTITEMGYFFKTIYNDAVENKNTFTPVSITFNDVSWLKQKGMDFFISTLGRETAELQYA